MLKHGKELPTKNNFKFKYLIAAYVPVLLPVAGIFRVLLYLLLFAATSYYIINLFTRLTGVNMFSAYSWSVHEASSKPFILFPLIAGICFTISFLVIIALLRVPSQVMDMKNNNIAGLMGYEDANNMLWLYDPVQSGYISCNNYSPKATPGRFTDLFKIILLYKAPGDKYYYDTEFLSLSQNIGRVFLIVLFLALIYPLLYIFAGIYIKENSLTLELSNQLMLSRYREIAGMPAGFAAVIALAVLMIIPAFSIISVKRIVNNYNGIYEPYRESLLMEIKGKVFPGSTVRGSVIQRSVYTEREEITDNESMSRRKNVTHTTFYNYTIKFENITGFPVYLALPFYSGSEDAKMLERAFADVKTTVPETRSEYDFTVNDDYSVRLKRREE